MKKIVIIGAGAHSKVIIDILEEYSEYSIVGLTDVSERKEILGYPILGDDTILKDLHEKGTADCAFIAIGDNKLRKELFNRVKTLGFEMVNAISCRAIVSKYSQLGEGVAVMPGAVVNAEAIIGDGTIINTNASVDHDCIIGEFVHIAPGSALSGITRIGSGCLIGTGTSIIDSISVGNNTIIGAGSVVVNDIRSDCLAYGVPAREIKKI